ncbi:MAG TPA: SH3 domain-containing protein [Aggregatilineales bacterium]|nr:SH3 domain-containing protein [Aggregatilineales bacterium]
MSKRNTPHFYLLTTVVLLALCVSFVPSIVLAQGITVATTSNARLRAGPGTDFAELALIPAGTTLAAVGRNADSSWIQVNYNGTVGWIAAFLLSISGDVNSLPVIQSDQGGAPAAAAPAVPASDVPPPPPGVVSATTSSTINVRASASTGAAKLGELPPNTTVVLITRSGSGGNAWVSFDFQGQRGWIAGWLVQINGEVNSLRDVQARTQGLDALQRALDTARSRWEPIAPFWRDLAAGQTVFCSTFASTRPSPASINASILTQNPDIADALNVLNTGINETRRAIDEKLTECRIDRQLVPNNVVDSGVSAVNNADNSFIDVQNRINSMRLN